MTVVFAVFGSLGDVHPMIAVALELKRRGHQVEFAAMEGYREKIELLGFGFRPMRPNFDHDDRELVKKVMDVKNGPPFLIRELLLPNLRPMFDDLLAAVDGADVLVSGEVVFAARSVAEKSNLGWVTTTLAPGTFLSPTDPFIPPTAMWLRHFRWIGRPFFGPMLALAKRVIGGWFEPYRRFRAELGLPEHRDPLFDGKSAELHLAMFSGSLGEPQPDWPASAVQTGFCFYDGQLDLGEMPLGLEEFLDAGEPPIVFTLGSAAVMDARDFFTESAKAAKLLGRRALLLYGTLNDVPRLDESGDWKIATGSEASSKIAAFDYAPYSKVFPRAACVVHQGGVGTTAQVMRAGVPHLVMPYSHDQPDNAARCERLGIGRIIGRYRYDARRAALEIGKILGDESYSSKARAISATIRTETGAETAADSIENLLLRRDANSGNPMGADHRGGINCRNVV